jgi:hypothetical protein
MHSRSLAPLLTCLAILVVGCGETAIDDSDDEDIAETEQAIVSTNALGMNALGMNALGMNALGMNALGMNALGMNALAAIQEDSPLGVQNRQLLEYTVSCALTPSQSFTFSWTDSAGAVHNEAYPGLLGLAPGWATGPITSETEQRMISACLAARTNWYGLTVLISLRSVLAPLRNNPTDQELISFPYVEGAFWGNLFGAYPALYTCFEPGNIARARLAHRDCAAGHLDENGQPVECGIINIVGSCTDVCGNLDPHERWYTACAEPGAPSRQSAIAVALP